ncbi:hypothetical protein AB1Y20_004218 [Prymnesium parvum]|uniref:FAD-binding domain-containing protein n=1 Tax=Prymnesium parvum TaxID=97485 RepID=A0AB34J782_PRYPA
MALAALLCALPAAELAGLRAAVVGAGPSGLLLAHRLLLAGASVHLLEERASVAGVAGRAYALGLGLRGRTALRSVDESLWRAVAAAGFASDRFTLHLPWGPLALRSPSAAAEPSVLVYQSELCAALLHALHAAHDASGRLQVEFGARVASVDARAGLLTREGRREPAAFDLIAGCDGVRSAVRASIGAQCAAFEAEVRTLPGRLKVVRLPAMPPPLAADAVHLLPGRAGLAAFVEPTASGACVLFSWRGEGAEPDPAAITEPDAARAFLAAAFPLIAASLDRRDVGEQFVSQRPSAAQTVRCNTYHFGRAVLVGDAAHSTGGASGQGCNSALQDAAALADLLVASGGEVAAALERYSYERLPEGHALLDLSVGPPQGAGPLRRLVFGLSAVTETVRFSLGVGDPPLQTQLTTSLTPFAEIRRKRDAAFGAFPTDEEFKAMVRRAIGA